MIIPYKELKQLPIQNLEEEAKRMEIILSAEKKYYEHKMNRRYAMLSYLAMLALILGVIAINLVLIVYSIGKL